MPGAGAQGQLLGCCSTAFLLSSTLPTAGSCNSRASFDPCPAQGGLLSTGVRQKQLGTSAQIPVCAGDSPHPPPGLCIFLFPPFPGPSFLLPSLPATSKQEFCFHLQPLFIWILHFHSDPSFPHFYDFQCDSTTLLTSNLPTSLHSGDAFSAN